MLSLNRGPLIADNSGFCSEQRTLKPAVASQKPIFDGYEYIPRRVCPCRGIPCAARGFPSRSGAVSPRTAAHQFTPALRSISAQIVGRADPLLIARALFA
jgi:hypothetical protein